MSKKIGLVIGGVVVLLLVGGGAFYGGMKYGQSNVKNNFRGPNERMQFGNANGIVGGNGSGFRGVGTGKVGNMLNGEVLNKDSQSITLKLQDGGSKIVILSKDTQISKMATTSIDEVKVGENLIVSGATNQDGSVTAQTIQIRPAIVKPVDAN